MTNTKLYLTKRGDIYYLGKRISENKVRWQTTKCRRKSDALPFLKSYQDKIDTPAEVPTLLNFFNTTFTQRTQGTIRPSTLNQYTFTLRQFISLLGDKRLNEYTLSDLDKYRDARLAKNKPVTFNVELRALKSLFNKAERWSIIDNNILRKISAVSVTKNLPTFLSQDEFRKLHEHTKEQVLKDIYLWSVMTGCRISETLQMRWDNIDMAARNVIINNSDTFTTKTSCERIVPMNSTLFEMLNRRFIENGSRIEYVFHRRGFKLNKCSVTHHFKKSIRALGFSERYKLHSLRHTFASWGCSKWR
jgi:integrase